MKKLITYTEGFWRIKELTIDGQLIEKTYTKIRKP